MELLIDQHCHSVVGADLDADRFASLCTEAAHATLSNLDSQVGLAVRRWCPPALDLPPHASWPEYLDRRAELGWAEAGRRLLRAAGLCTLLVETGIQPPEAVAPARLGEWAGAGVHEVVRLEQVAESLHGTVDAAGFAAAFERALAARLAAGAVGVKSIIAYRWGLAIPAQRPSTAEVTRAAGGWLAGPARLTDPVLLRFVLWQGVATGLPVQLHTGFGDPDLALAGADPALAQPFLAAHRTPVVLLHCYPYQRQAGWLALAYPHVFVDVGLTVTNLGARAPAVLAEFVELAPFDRLLFSTDAYALPELYLAGAAGFRHALARLLDGWLADAALSRPDAARFVEGFGAGNARRLYRLAD
jgi:uncharacterized protein